MELYREAEKYFPQMEKLFKKQEWERFLQREFEELPLYHYTLGGWIRNKLLEKGSVLERMFIRGGVTDKDDMSMLIIEWFYLYAKTKQAER